MAGLATLFTDWPTALVAAERRLSRRPDEEGALVARAVALWELGREDDARATVALGDGSVPVSRLRAAVRFHHHLDDPAGAQAALDRLAAPSPVLALAVARGWRRHGELDRAIAGAERLLAREPAHAGAASVLRKARAEARTLAGEWRPDALPAAIDPVPGRVLHMLQRSLPHHRSGSTYRTHYTVHAQLRAGLAPQILTQPGFGAGVEHDDGIPVHRLARAGRPAGLDDRLAAYLEAADPVVRRVRPSVLHPASDYVNALVAIELGRLHRIPVVYEVRGFPELLEGRWAGARGTYVPSIARRRLEVGCWHAADRVVTLAEVMKAHIVGHGVPPDRVVVVPNAVDPEAFRPVAPDPALRARLGIARGDLVLGYVSTLVSYEGLPYLVEAVARLTGRGRAVRALIVGDGPEQLPVRQLARRLGVADRVLLPGRVAHEDVLAYYALMDVFVVPRTDEPTTQLVTPLKPYEAMACAKPVVVSRTPALREMVLEGRTGLSFAPEDAEDLAQVVERLASDPGLRASLGAGAREWVVANRGWDANARRYVELYRELGAL